MPLALTCKCGARLEIDDKFAGQRITCPDCQQPLVAPPSPPASQVTSGLALASIVLALIGAFTVVGTVFAVVLGALALMQIARRPEQLAGRGYAIAGIVIGVLMTTGTVLALSPFELFGLTAIMGNGAWASNLEYNGPLEVDRYSEGFAITRPTKDWGVYKPPMSKIGGDLNLSAWDDLLLVLPGDDAVILCFAERVGTEDDIAKCREKFIADFKNMTKFGLFPKTAKSLLLTTSISINDSETLPAQGDVDGVEMQIDKQAGSEDKSFLVRVFKRRGDDRMFVAICGVRHARYQRLESQFRRALESFRVLPRNWRPDW